MYFTSGQDRAFERLMQEKPSFNHYDGGGANAPEDCGSCRFYRPDWKYQYCVYAECPYQPGKLTALAAVKFTVKGADDDMAVFRVEKNKGYTVMSNHHLRNKALSLKAKGLLSQMLSLPEDWDYTLKGLSLINRESIDAIRTAVWELERAGYIRREQGRDTKGKMADMVYTIYEQPVLAKPVLENPVLENPTSDNPTSDNPASGNPTQLNKEIQRTNLPRKEKINTDLHLFCLQLLFSFLQCCWQKLRKHGSQMPSEKLLFSIQKSSRDLTLKRCGEINLYFRFQNTTGK